MKRIFQLLGRRWKACLVIFALLLLQAWCDLSLPGYTSDIVDVGIQMGGIESTVPETVRTDPLQALEWLMPQEDAQQVEAAFSPADENGLRTLTATGAKAKDHTWNGLVEFDHVSFRYPGGDTDALEDISFTARPGQTTAIIGSTGCGKSTLLNLIPRFFDATQGHVRIDGVDVRDMPQAQLRALLGYVPQKGVLFSGTIESNLKFGGPQITDDAARKAAEIAQATEFIETKPEEYQSPIAQGGTNVSGGQKQRLSIARAILADNRILILDEATSSVDTRTEEQIQAAMDHLMQGRTSFVIAHRLSTIKDSDLILVMRDGDIVEQGTHDQLLEQGGFYADLYNSQFEDVTA